MPILGGISDRITRLESLQREQTTKTVKKPEESRFGSVLGAGMTIQALDGPPQKMCPTDVGARQQDFGKVGVHRGDYGAAGARAEAMLEPARPRHQAKPDVYPGLGMPDRFFDNAEPQVFGMPNER